MQMRRIGTLAFLVAGTAVGTRFHYADGGDNLVEWTCEREIGNIPGRAKIISSEFLETHT